MAGRRWLREISLQFLGLVAALVLALLGAELVARHRYPNLRYDAARQARPEDLFMQFDRHMGWVNVPGKQVRFRRLDFDTKVTINADGFRGPEVPLARTPGRFRIVLLGDSYAFGHGVNDGETSADHLARLLPATDVVNLGVTGYSTDQELLLLRERGLAWRPDLVILYLCANDLLDNGKETAWGLYWKPRFLLSGDSLRLDREILPDKVPENVRLQRAMRRRFVLYDVMTWRLARLQSGRLPPAIDAGGDEPNEKVDANSGAGRLTRALLREMIHLCTAQGAKFLLVVIPPFPSPELVADLPPPEAGARLDLGPVFREYQAAHPDSALGFRYDPHWNARGQRLVAQSVADLIQARGWWPAGSR